MLEAAKEKAVQSKSIILRSYRGVALSTLSLMPNMENKHGVPFLNMHRADLHTLLFTKAKSVGVEIHLGAQVTSIDFATPSVMLSGGETLRYDVILGGDGDGSISRQALLGHPTPRYHSGDQVFAITLNTEAVRQREDLRNFIDPPNTNVWFGPNAHVVVYPVRDNQLHVILSRTEGTTEMVHVRPQIADINELKSFFKDWDPTYRKLLDNAQSAVKWTLTETTEPKTWCHSTGKFALIGDSAHAMLPYLYVPNLLNSFVSWWTDCLQEHREQRKGSRTRPY